MLTEDKVTGIYFLIDDMLKYIRHSEDSHRRIVDNMRKQNEQSISETKALFLRTIHAVTQKGFLLKVVLSYTLSK